MGVQSVPQVTQGEQGGWRISRGTTPVLTVLSPVYSDQGCMLHCPERTFFSRWPSPRAGDLQASQLPGACVSNPGLPEP